MRWLSASQMLAQVMSLLLLFILLVACSWRALPNPPSLKAFAKFA